MKLYSVSKIKLKTLALSTLIYYDSTFSAKHGMLLLKTEMSFPDSFPFLFPVFSSIKMGKEV